MKCSTFSKEQEQKIKNYEGFKAFGLSCDPYLHLFDEMDYAVFSIEDETEKRNYKIKAFCKLLNYHCNFTLKAMAKWKPSPEVDAIRYASFVKLDNVIQKKIVDFAKEGYWLDDVMKTYYKTDLETIVDPKLKKWTYDIDGNVITEKKTHNYNLRPRNKLKPNNKYSY